MTRSIALLLLIAGCFHETNDALDEDTTSSSSSSATTSTTGTTTIPVTTTGSGSTSFDPDTTSSSTADPDTSSGEASSSSTGEPISDWALYFGGETSAASTDAVDLALGTEFTIEMWIRTDSADTRGTIASYRGVGTTGWSLAIEPMQSRFVFGFFDNNGAWNEVVGTDAADLDAGWHHVAGTKHGTSLYLHVDGEVAATAPCSAATSAPTVPILIGTDPDRAALIYSALDDIRVSSVARYQSSFAPPAELAADPSTAVLLVLDEGDGTACFDTGSAALTLDVQDATWVEGNT